MAPGFLPVAEKLGGTAELATAELAPPERTIRRAAVDHAESTSFLLVDGDTGDAERAIYELLGQHLLSPAVSRAPPGARGRRQPAEPGRLPGHARGPGSARRRTA